MPTNVTLAATPAPGATVPVKFQPPNTSRTGVYWRVTGETLTPMFNPEKSDWSSQTPFYSAVDGLHPGHIAQLEFGSPANVRALPHFEVVAGPNGGISALGTDSKFLRGTLYPKVYSPTVSYSVLNGGPDKPRINLGNEAATQSLFPANVNWFHYRKDNRLSFGIFLPVDYVEDSGSWRENLLQVYGVSGAGDNDMDLSILGGGGGNAKWTLERTLNGSSIASHSTDVLDAHKGSWTIHTFFFNMDNRSIANGGTPKFEWVMNTNGQAGTVVASDNVSAWGFATGTPITPWKVQFGLAYKGGWHGATQGPYTGNKTDPITLGLSSIRLGDSSSSYSDVHPTRDAHP